MLRAGSKLGQYRILGKLDEGGFAEVYRATDTIEGVKVALKIPHAGTLDKAMLEDFRREVRLAAQLDHPNILLIKHAGYMDGKFVIVYPLGKGSLDDRLMSRLSVAHALDLAGQMLDAVACAHEHKIVHLDIKPDNFILFDGNRLRLADFGLAKVARYTFSGTGSGTLGYISPEQAMGKPSFRSDVFSLGLIIYRMLSGKRPEWPYEWPYPGQARARKALSPELLDFLKKATEVDAKKRFADAIQMRNAFMRLRPRALKRASLKKTVRRRRTKGADLDQIRFKLFLQRFGKELGARFKCKNCRGPVSEAMLACPWCGRRRRAHPDASALPGTCRRCGRGRKLDWRFCAWCFGPAFKTVADRSYSDRRYAGACSACRKHVLMPFTSYCPLCRTKVRRKWAIRRAEKRCPRCRWSVLPEFWKSCPWCAKTLG